jgi:colanic acid/amylovoran biosynthesis protein
MPRQTDLRISLFGSPGAGLNLGVGALRESALVGLLERRPDATVTVFDDGWGVRPAELHVDGVSRSYQLCGVRNSRRVHKQESYAHMRLAARLGIRNRGLEVVDASSAVWDVSGGDSFTDMYGRQRFFTVTLPKELALSRGRRLVLLPQTYGPFNDSNLSERARSVLVRTEAAWARDVDSYDALQELLAADFDSERHRLGVDLAFGLPPAEPDPRTNDAFRHVLDAADGAPVVGLNVSGLLLNDPAASDRYGLTIDYAALVESLAEMLLARGAVVVLVPHVLGFGTVDSDEDVTERLARRLRKTDERRVVIAPRQLGAGGRKWLIRQLDWFSGARMHSTIAGLSSGVPTAAVAYSGKVRGVFSSCRQESQVADGRTLTTEDALDLLIESFDRREQTRRELAAALPSVLDQARAQMDCIVEQSQGRAGEVNA